MTTLKELDWNYEGHGGFKSILNYDVGLPKQHYEIAYI